MGKMMIIRCNNRKNSYWKILIINCRLRKVARIKRKMMKMSKWNSKDPKILAQLTKSKTLTQIPALQITPHFKRNHSHKALKNQFQNALKPISLVIRI